MTFERVENAEPAALAGLVTSLAGFLALLASDFSAPHSAALGVGMPAVQALLTRPFVYSPRSIRALESGRDVYRKIPEVLRTARSFSHPHEPAATIGTISLLAGFLVQVFAGVDFLGALASAAGIAGVQTAATRARVSSPVTACTAAANGVANDLPGDDGAVQAVGLTSS